jgi:hypothetical protein
MINVNYTEKIQFVPHNKNTSFGLQEPISTGYLLIQYSSFTWKGAFRFNSHNCCTCYTGTEFCLCRILRSPYLKTGMRHSVNMGDEPCTLNLYITYTSDNGQWLACYGYTTIRHIVQGGRKGTHVHVPYADTWHKSYVADITYVVTSVPGQIPICKILQY